MRSFLRRHAEFFGHVAVLMSGKTIAALVALFTMPIVARLFLPADFGIAAVFASIAGIVSTVASLRYAAALVLPKEETEATSLMALSYRIMLSVSAAMLIFMGAYEVAGFEWAALDLLGGWKWLLPFAVLLMSALHIQDSWLTRHKAFKTISSSLVARNVSTGASRIAFGALFGSSVYGLIAGYFLGLICRFAVQASAVRDGLRATFSDIGWPATKEIARRYSDFPKFNAPAGLVFSMGQNLPVLMFGVMFSPVMAGLYAMADRLSQVPVTIVATSVRRVFLQKASEIDNRGGSLRKAFLLSTGALALVGTVPFACLWLFGQPLATWILGDRWLVAGQYLEILAPWLFLVWSAAPCNAIFVVLRKQKFWLSLTITITILRLGVFGYAHVISAGPEWTLQAFVLVSIIGILITITTTLVLVLRHTPQNSPAVDIAE